MRELVKTAALALAAGALAALMVCYGAGVFDDATPPILEADPRTTEVELTP